MVTLIASPRPKLFTPSPGRKAQKGSCIRKICGQYYQLHLPVQWDLWATKTAPRNKICTVTCRLACRGRGCRRPRPAQVRPGVSVFSVGHGLTESFALSHWYLCVMEQRSPEEGTSWAALRHSLPVTGTAVREHRPKVLLLVPSSWPPHRALSVSCPSCLLPCDLGQSTCPRHGGDNYTSVTQCPRGECSGMAAPSPGVVTAGASLLCPPSAPGHRGSAWGTHPVSSPPVMPREDGSHLPLGLHGTCVTTARALPAVWCHSRGPRSSEHPGSTSWWRL